MNRQPCKGCTERHLLCKVDCPKWAEVVKEKEQIKEANKRERELRDYFFKHHRR